jgi:hypothetical protein
MTIKIKKSPNPKKKFRANFEDGSHVDFGAQGYSDYTIHKNPMRMRLYVQRHGGEISKSLLSEIDPRAVQNKMLKVSKSDKEYWSKNGIKSAGFWSRWFLWSFPNYGQAKNFIEKKFKIKISMDI